MRVLRGLLDMLAPPRCAACDAELELGLKAGSDVGAEGFCAVCAPLLEPVAGAEAAMAALRFGGPLASALRRFKYGARPELARPLALAMCARARRAAVGLDVIVPVPLHASRLRERGYDQTSLLAGELVRHLEMPRRLELLSRQRATATQASLDRSGRLANVAGAFVASPRVEGLSVLLLDDVRTTGATLGDAARALLAAGATRVQPLALALAELGSGAASGAVSGASGRSS